MNVKDNWVNQTLIFVGFVFPIVLAWLWKTEFPIFKPLNKKNKITIQCISGDCWTQRSDSYLVLPVEEHQALEIAQGDFILTLGKGSELSAYFSETSSEMHLKGSAIAKAVPGLEEIEFKNNAGGSTHAIEPGSSNDPGESDQNSPPSLMYVGEIPVQLKTPKKNDEILVSKFPLILHFSFESPRDDPRLAEWTVAQEDNAHNDLVTKTIQPLQWNKQANGSFAYFGEIQIANEGHFVMWPHKIMPARPDGLNFTVKTAKDMQHAIENVLEGLKTDQKRNLEIRSQ